MAIDRIGGPTALVLTRQAVPVLDRSGCDGMVGRGGYVLRPGSDAVLVATGSEVAVALGAADLLGEAGVSLQVVSLPCWEAFFAEDPSYREEVLGSGLPVASLEAGTTFGWERIVGSNGLSIGIDRFGASAPGETVQEQLGLTPARVADAVREAVRRATR